MNTHPDNKPIVPISPDLVDDVSGIEAGSITGVMEVGQWYWFEGQNGEELGCVTNLGSNYAEISTPVIGQSRYCFRVLFTEAHQKLRFEPDAQAVIQGKVQHFQQLANDSLNQVRAITSRLGVSPSLSVENKRSSSGNDLVALNAAPDIEGYKQALIKAKDQDLPALFESIRKANEALAAWMSAETLPMMAIASQSNTTITTIKNRIFNVSLYAGLTEAVVQFADGEPAQYDEKLRVMQRRLYMDEECLLNYRLGGMEFKHINAFDSWMAEPENRDRILPFPRCIVAMQVRRKRMERDSGGDLQQALINFQLAQADKLTFLYIRNGEKLYRMDCDLDFGEMIFPDKSSYNPGEPMMVKMFCSRIDSKMTLSEYEQRVAEHEERLRKAKQWEEENPLEQWKKDNPGRDYDWDNPHKRSSGRFNPHEWKAADHNHPYFDEYAQEIAAEINQYNRIAMIIQGLFDRSEVLHPHAPVRAWTPEGFNAAIELVYDASLALTYGEAPDFEAYRKKCNALITAESVLVGQEDYWLRKEADKENRRLDNDWRVKHTHRHVHFKPYGNDGPGYIAKPAEWKPRSGNATFTWHRERLTDGGYFSNKNRGDLIKCSIAVPADALFNVSAYQPGDYRQFFVDPRTRAQYLKWAPMLLAAEEYHAGSMLVRGPV